MLCEETGCASPATWFVRSMHQGDAEHLVLCNAHRASWEDRMTDLRAKVLTMRQIGRRSRERIGA